MPFGWIVAVAIIVAIILYVADRAWFNSAVKNVEWDIEVAKSRIKALEGKVTPTITPAPASPIVPKAPGA